MPHQITALVDRGLYLRAQINEMKDELETIEAKLREAAIAGPQTQLEDSDREGRQYLAQGTETTVPIILTADIIQATFTDASAVHSRIEAASGGKLLSFYRPTTTWKMLAKDGKQFRLEASGILGDTAPAFISACLARDKHGIPKSQVKVEWDRATGILTTGGAA